MSIGLRTDGSDGRRIETSGGKSKHRVDLTSRYVELLNNIVDARTCFRCQTRQIRASGSHETPMPPPNRPGTLSTAGHWDQSRLAIFVHPFTVTLITEPRLEPHASSQDAPNDGLRWGRRKARNILMSVTRDVTSVGTATLVSRTLAFLRDMWIAAILVRVPQPTPFSHPATHQCAPPHAGGGCAQHGLHSDVAARAARERP